jgi:hypothetical protein
LSSPASQYPRVFGGIWFFEQYPYALPSIVASMFGFSATIISAIYLKEVSQLQLFTIALTNKAIADSGVSKR